MYGKYGQPQFSSLPWCLVDSNYGFVYLYCNGLDYSLVFDSESFLQGKDSADFDTNYEVLRQIPESEVIPALIEDVSTVGDALTVISKG